MKGRALVAKAKRVNPERAAWFARADAGLRTADELLWLVGRSLQVLEAFGEGRDGYADDVLSESSSADDALHLARVVSARGRAEGKLDATFGEIRPLTFAAAIEPELFCLLHALDHLATRYVRDANSAAELATTRRIGRPRTVPRNALEALVYRGAWKKKGKPGRPKRIAIEDGELSAMLERERHAGAPTSRAAARAIAEAHLLNNGTLPPAGWRREQELEEHTRSLEKRISALRLGIRKLRKKASE